MEMCYSHYSHDCSLPLQTWLCYGLTRLLIQLRHRVHDKSTGVGVIIDCSQCWVDLMEVWASIFQKFGPDSLLRGACASAPDVIMRI